MARATYSRHGMEKSTRKLSWTPLQPEYLEIGARVGPDELIPPAQQAYLHLVIVLREEVTGEGCLLRAEIAAGKVAGRDAYLARWNEFAGEAELVEGKYPW